MRPGWTIQKTDTTVGGQPILYWRLGDTAVYLEAFNTDSPEETVYYLVMHGGALAKVTQPLVNTLDEAMEWVEKKIQRIAVERV